MPKRAAGRVCRDCPPGTDEAGQGNKMKTKESLLKASGHSEEVEIQLLESLIMNLNVSEKVVDNAVENLKIIRGY